MLLRLVAVGIPIGLLLAFSLAAFFKERNASSLIELVGAALLVAVVLIHVAEAYHLFPQMGWGLPNSPGHYLDLSSAIAGTSFFTIGYVLRWHARRKKRN